MSRLSAQLAEQAKQLLEAQRVLDQSIQERGERVSEIHELISVLAQTFDDAQ